MKRPHENPVDPELDEARLLPHLRERSRLLSAADLRRAQAAVLREALVDQPDAVLPGRFAKPAPGDLRGIPVVGDGVGGVQPGTQPEREAVRGRGRRRVVIEDVGTRVLLASRRRAA